MFLEIKTYPRFNLKDGSTLSPFIDQFTNNEIFLFFTDFVFELTTTIKENLISYGFDETELNDLFASDDKACFHSF